MMSPGTGNGAPRPQRDRCSTPAVCARSVLSAGRWFTDVEAFAESCRFGNCAHDTEPGCAVVAAIESGLLPERRLASYRRLRREIQWQDSRTDARLSAERAQVWKQHATQNCRQSGNRP